MGAILAANGPPRCRLKRGLRRSGYRTGANPHRERCRAHPPDFGGSGQPLRHRLQTSCKRTTGDEAAHAVTSERDTARKRLQTADFRPLVDTGRHRPGIALDQVVKVRILAPQPGGKPRSGGAFCSRIRKARARGGNGNGNGRFALGRHKAWSCWARPARSPATSRQTTEPAS
jgi:hypothetical protein